VGVTNPEAELAFLASLGELHAGRQEDWPLENCLDREGVG
jgi:hypothetical protein